MERYPLLLDRQNQYIEMVILLKLLYRFNSIPIKIPIIFLTEPKKVILKLTWNQKRSRITKAILGKGKRDNNPSLQLLLLSYSDKNSMLLAKKTQKTKTDEWINGTDQKIQKQLQAHLIIFDNRTKSFCRREDDLFNKWYWENWFSTC